MTVGEMIQRLQGLPSDMQLVTPGFDESGYSDVQTIEFVSILRAAGSGGHIGEHKEAPLGACYAEMCVNINW